MNTKRIVSILVVILMLSSFVAVWGCTDKKPGGGTKSGSDTTANPEDQLNPGLEAIDYEQFTFKILTHRIDQFVAEETDVGIVNQAVYKRNLALMEKYNIKIETYEVTTSSAAYNEKVAASVNAGDDAYDALTPSISYAFTLGINGYLTEFGKIPHVNTQKTYWWRNVLEDSSVAGKNFFAISDANSFSFTQMALVMFNKEIVQDNQMGNLYDLVNEGKWTIDKMMELSQKCYRDLDGNSQYSVGDQYGLTGNSYMTDCFLYGMDMLFVPKDENDMPYFDVEDNEKFVDFFTKVRTFFNDKTTLYGEYQKGTNARQTVPQAAFQEGRVLFWVESMGWVETMRDIDIDFGLLPMPKADENQENYSNSLHAWTSSAFAVPTTSEENLDRTGRILEDMAYYSYIKIRPAYYDVFLTGVLTRDEESAEMIPYIIDNCRTDFAMVFRTSGLTFMDDMRSIASNPSLQIASQISRKSNSYKNIISNLSNKVIDS